MQTVAHGACMYLQWIQNNELNDQKRKLIVLVTITLKLLKFCIATYKIGISSRMISRLEPIPGLVHSRYSALGESLQQRKEVLESSTFWIVSCENKRNSMIQQTS